MLGLLKNSEESLPFMRWCRNERKHVYIFGGHSNLTPGNGMLPRLGYFVSPLAALLDCFGSK